MSEKEVTRVSTVRKSIIRKFNLGNYENIDIIIDQSHEVEWNNIEEFMKKSSGVTRLVAKDFQETVQLVAEELGLDEKKAFLNEYGSPKSNEKIANDDDFDSL